MGGARASGGQKSQAGSSIQIFTFSCTKFLNFITTGAELGQYFCAYTIEKQIEDSTGGS